MAGIAKRAADRIIETLAAPSGLPAAVEELAKADGIDIGTLDARNILSTNVAAEIAERALELKYPVVSVYCEKEVNNLREKFRVFSGSVRLAIEVRATQDRLEGLGSATELYADAVARILDGSRGDWGNGMYYAGGYEIDFAAVKRGGRGFLQSAKVSFEVQISR
jgi:hypothetical protein